MRNRWTRILALGAAVAALGLGQVAAAQTPPSAAAAPTE